MLTKEAATHSHLNLLDANKLIRNIGALADTKVGLDGFFCSHHKLVEALCLCVAARQFHYAGHQPSSSRSITTVNFLPILLFGFCI